MIEAIRKAFPYLYIVPNGKQGAFLNMHAFINIWVAANKVGKTCAGAIKLIRRMKESKIRARIASDPTSIQEMVVPEILKWLGQEAGAWKIMKKGRLFDSYFEAPNGSVCDILTYEQKPKEFEAIALDYLWLDEPPPQGIWGACTSRFLTGSLNVEINLTMTPLHGAAWVNDDLIAKADGKHIDYLHADIEDNCIEHGERGRIPHSRIEEIISDYDKDEYEARAHGHFMYLSGRIYDCFNPDEHIIDPFEIPGSANLYQINDPHDRKYPALSWIFLTQDEHAFVYDEWPTEPFEKLKSCPYTIPEIVRIMKAKEEGKKFVRLMDPNFGATISQQTGVTTYKAYKKCGLSYRLAEDNMEMGHNAVRSLLKRKRFKIFRNCRNHWHFMQRYSWKDFHGKTAEDRSISEKVSDLFKDFADNVRYFALGYPKWKDPLPEGVPESSFWDEEASKDFPDTHRQGHWENCKRMEKAQRGSGKSVMADPFKLL